MVKMKSSKKFNLGLLLVIPLIFAAYFLSVYFVYFDNKNDSLSVETYFAYKEALADSITTNKILFTSGSNNFLGIRAYQVEEAFGVPSVNMSIHAGLRAEYILDRLKQSLQKGDMVILPFEYSNFGYNGEPSITLNKYLLSYDKEYLNSHYDLVDRLKILSSISVLDLSNSIFMGTNENEENDKRIEYLKHINANGDMLNMTEHDSLKTKKPPFKLPVPFNLETTGLKSIKAFSAYCRENDIHLFITFPNLVKEKAYSSDKYQAYFDHLLIYFKQNNIDVIGTPEDAMYPKQLFFDSEYHLISKGSDLRTADFIELMKQKTDVLNALNAMASPKG